MEVSVVIPTKDRLDSLQRVLPSYLMQEEVKEVIFINDGSSDGTLEYLESYCRESDVVRFLDNGENRGIPYSKNRGIDAAKFEYIFIGEDDLELTENFFQTLSNHMESVGADVICGRNIFRDTREEAAESIARTDKFEGPYVNMRTIEVETGMNLVFDQEVPILASPMLAKAAVFREVRFDEIYRVNFWREETDFQLSAREHGYKLAACPHAICFDFYIANDRGGVYSEIGVRREIWVVINNWRFVKKHEKFIKENFYIGNKNLYILKFAASRILKYIVWPPILITLSSTKRFLLRRPPE
jgi:GT2 family glycosyltransferase